MHVPILINAGGDVLIVKEIERVTWVMVLLRRAAAVYRLAPELVKRSS